MELVLLSETKMRSEKAEKVRKKLKFDFGHYVDPIAEQVVWQYGGKIAFKLNLECQQKCYTYE